MTTSLISKQKNTNRHLTGKNISFLSEEDVLTLLKENNQYNCFLSFTKRNRRLFLDFCTGKNLKLLTYDKIFKYIFSPSHHKHRLERFLSAILGFDVEVLEILENEGEKIANAGSFVILDIVVKVNDGSIINVEMQKHPYMFSGERESCYLADMIMRQYNFLRARGQELYPKAYFDYSQMHPVYSIVFIENSYYDFLEYSNDWIHRGKIMFDTGLSINYLSNVIYITLDIFRKIVENNINTESEKWVYLLSADTPERIMKAASLSDEMFGIIAEVASFCMNTDEVMSMFSQVLRELDRGTEAYMVEVFKQEKDELAKEINSLAKEKDSLAKEKDNLAKEVDSLTKKVEGFTQKNDDLVKEVTQLKAIISELQKNQT